jgi:hypothetical protein
MNGLAVIRAFHKVAFFEEQLRAAVDNQNVSHWSVIYADNLSASPF